MEPRVFLAQPGSTLFDNPDAVVLYRYSNGEALIRTSTPTAERPAEHGLRLDAGLAVALEEARTRFKALREKAAVILAYVEMVGPIARPWLVRLREMEVTALQYQPLNAYLCRGTVAAFENVAREPFVLRVTPLTAGLKRAPRLPDSSPEPASVWIIAYADAGEKDRVIEELRALAGVTVEASPPAEVVDHFVHVPARVTREGEASARDHAFVLAVEDRRPPEPEDEVANLIVCGQHAGGKPFGSYLQWLEDHGVSGLGVAIGIVDAGVDRDHAAFQGRIKDFSEGARDWHGTFVAGHAAGAYLDEKDANGFIYGIGVAPRAELFIQNNQKAPAELCRETVRGVGPGGARGAVQNNSWGTGLSSNPAHMSYGAVEAAYDSLVRNADPDAASPRPLTICFSTGNSGSKGLTRPKAAKNVIVTGNSESCRRDVGRADSDNINEVYTGTHASSWGNCGDGRVRPDLVAPGEWTAAAGYDSHEGEKEYISPKLTWGGGSSAASPKTAGACALVIQWWRRHHSEPSPALVRALLVNGAEPMNFRQPIPNPYEGWGRLNLGNVFDDKVARVYEDQTVLLGERGEKREWKVRVVDPGRPVKVTLAWTDPPGAVGSGDTPANGAIVNSLVLRAFVGATAYRGNNFQNGWSVSGEVPGAQAEGADNLQNVFLPAGVVSGAFRVVVEARNITADCLAPRSVTPQQDFALVISNACLDEAGVPTDVFVNVDPQDHAEPAHDPNDHWQPGGADDDEAELADGPIDPSQGAATGASSSAQDEEAWWDAGEDGLNNETSRARPPRPENGGGEGALALSMSDRRLSESVATGVDLIAASGGRVLFGTGSAGETGEAAPLVSLGRDADTAVVRASLTRDGALPLSIALERLEGEQGASAGARSGVVARRCAVLIVGAGTRVTRLDLRRMRRIALFGQLYLLSEDVGVLRFLAQRLYKNRGVSFRLADAVTGLPALIRDTLAEASGAQRVVVEDGAAFVLDGRVSRVHRFQVISADRRVALHVTHPPGEVPTLRLRWPGQEGLAPFDLSAPGAGVVARRGETLMVVAIPVPADGGAWNGTWEVELSQPAPRGVAANVVPSARLRAWSWGDLHLRAERREGAPDGGERRLEGGEPSAPLVLEGGEGVSFRSVQVGVQTGVSGEQRREVAVAPLPSRLDRVDVGIVEGEGVEAERLPLLAGTISIPVPSRRLQPGASVAGLLLRATGKDAGGNDFQREVRTDVVALEPRSAWRERVAALASKFIVLTGARVVRVEYNAQTGEIAALRLQKNNKRRTVRVAAASLRQVLARVDLTVQNLLFHVRNDELHAAVMLLGGSLPETADPGIEGPIPEPAPVGRESGRTDYPDASRFVPAKFFRASTGPRRIERVVIHITDGGPRIGGTVAWFQNPRNVDGTYRKVSAHYVVGQDGEVVQMVRDRDVAYHASRANGDSIGIEHVARSPRAFGPRDAGLRPTPVEYAASAALVRWLCEQYGIPMDREHILGHAEVDLATTHAGCPNAAWDWDHYMRLVRSGMSLPAPDLFP